MTGTKKKLKRYLKITSMATIILLAIGEITVRLLGVTDFPIYDQNEKIGYIPKANQCGQFLNTNTFYLNDRNMGVKEDWVPNGDKDLLLIGDSLVWCGNPFKHEDKVGPRLQEALENWKVWPVGAGSWTVENQFVWMDQNSDVLEETDVIVWILNSGDIAPKSIWSSQSTHPTFHPVSGLQHAFNKYIFQKYFRSAPPKRLENPHDKEKLVSSFRHRLLKYTQSGKSVIVTLYPEVDELGEERKKAKEYEKFCERIRGSLAPNCMLLNLQDETSWNEELYRDGIHANVKGWKVLAALLAEKVSSLSQYKK